MSWLSRDDLIGKIIRNSSLEIMSAFDGVYSIDELPEAVHQRPFFMIVNTHSHNLPGEHWKVVFIDEKKNGEVFDPLALPTSTLLSRWMNRFTRKWLVNDLTVQHPLSSTCGAHVLFYIFNRLQLRGMEDFLKHYSLSFSLNERIIHSFYSLLK